MGPRAPRPYLKLRCTQAVFGDTLRFPGCAVSRGTARKASELLTVLAPSVLPLLVKFALHVSSGAECRESVA